MQPHHRHSIDPNTLDTTITDTGALCAYSGLRTGRSPTDKRTVLDEVTKDVSKIQSFIYSDCLVGQSEYSNLSLGKCKE